MRLVGRTVCFVLTYLCLARLICCMGYWHAANGAGRRHQMRDYQRRDDDYGRANPQVKALFADTVLVCFVALYSWCFAHQLI
jgi:hypothetical protein